MRHRPPHIVLGAFVLTGLFMAPCTLADEATADEATADEATTVILVRHAEKNRSDPSDRDPRLTDEGRQRAQTLVHILGGAGVDAVYATPFRRTRDTARPLAEHLGLRLRTAPVGNHAIGMARRIGEHHAGQTVLVVGHSDTTPQLARALGALSPPIIEDHVYDELWVITMPTGEDGPARLLRLGYGTPTPAGEMNEASDDDAEPNQSP